VDIIDTAAAAGNFTLLAGALETAGLTDVLRGEGPFTVFAPSDEAVTASLSALGVSAEDFLARPDLQQILLYHVLPGIAAGAADLDEVVVADTAADIGEDQAPLTAVIFKADGVVSVNQAATVTTPDIQASNGVIHVIDQVLLPPSIVDLAKILPDFEILMTAVEVASLTETLRTEGKFTVFAPTDAAFAALLEELEMTADDLLADPEFVESVLLYHGVLDFILSTDLEVGEYEVESLREAPLNVTVTENGITVNGANVTQADIVGVNGVIHVIDAVLLPPM
jgi:transforming growth factor-beta-induced protein